MDQARFQNYVTACHYGNGDLSREAGKHNGLTHAWLSSSLPISPLERFDLLEELAPRQFPVKDGAYDMMSRATPLTTLGDGREVHAKAGRGFPAAVDCSSDEKHAFGWFFGWASKKAQNVVFVLLIQDDHAEGLPAGIRARDAILTDLPQILVSGAYDGAH